MQHNAFVRPPIVSALDPAELEGGVVHRRRIVITENATGNETLAPVIIVKAPEPGPVVGITAAIHGNELNGIPVIHKLVDVLTRRPLKRGALIAVPIVNLPGYVREQRTFDDGVDLNHIMPGKSDGNESELYAYRVMERIVRHCDYLVDLHTASFGRINSLYVRADMNDTSTAHMARLIAPQIILHNPGSDGTLRGAAAARGIKAITVEIGDPQRLQKGLVYATRVGIQAVLDDLGMMDNPHVSADSETVECERSRWMYTDRGGVLEVLPELAAYIRQGEVIARLRNVWGDLVREYECPADGIVIGKSTNPAARAGSRILHLGIVGRPSTAKDKT